MVAMASTEEVRSTSPCGNMPSRAPTVERMADEMAPHESPDATHEASVEEMCIRDRSNDEDLLVVLGRGGGTYDDRVIHRVRGTVD